MSERDRGLDLIRIPAATLGATIRIIREELGDTAGAATLRRIGLECGATFHERFRDWLSESGAGSVDPESLDRDVFWTRLSDFFDQLGWGRLEQESVHPGVISLRFTDWVEARQDPSPTGCHFTTGLVAELLRGVAGGELAALEIESDPADGGTARILLGNAVALDTLFATLQSGATFDEAVASLA